jgi:hypothetical protein
MIHALVVSGVAGILFSVLVGVFTALTRLPAEGRKSRRAL